MSDPPCATPTPSPPAVGELLAGRYRLSAVLGRGGFGTVYRARDTERGRDVAVKCLRSDAWEADVAQRWDNELITLEAVRHPGIVRFYEHGVDEAGRRYLVMAFVEGETLTQRLERAGGPLPVVEAIDYTVDVLDALSAMHALGIVHRDIKPDNVMVGPAGVQVLDLGVALLVGPERLTDNGEGLGTLTHAAPEQARGEPTFASDQYATGVMLYELLSGALPFRDPHPFALAQAHQTRPPPPLDAGLAVPPDVERVMRRALEKDPAHRFATVEVMAHALEAARPGPPRIPPLTRTRPLRPLTDGSLRIRTLEGLAWGREKRRGARPDQQPAATHGEDASLPTDLGDDSPDSQGEPHGEPRPTTPESAQREAPRSRALYLRAHRWLAADAVSSTVMVGALCLLSVPSAGSEPAAGRDTPTDAEVVVIRIGAREPAADALDVGVDEGTGKGTGDAVVGDAAMDGPSRARPSAPSPRDKAVASPAVRPPTPAPRRPPTPSTDLPPPVVHRPEVVDDATPPPSPERAGYPSEAEW